MSRENSERPFGIGELFFSATDPKGRILLGNPVFHRVSGYDRDELIGRPHNIVRHADMPRVVFRLLWDTLGAGQPIAAYVKNQAKDGAYYWVLASVVPSPNGFVSVRLKPSTVWFEAAQGIYEELRELEARCEAAGMSRTAAMDASAARLGELLNGAGFADYDAFMRVILPAEISARKAQLGHGETASAAARAAAGGGIRLATSACQALGAQLDRVFANVDAYAELNERLTSKTAFLLDLANQVTTFSLNAVLAASRLVSPGGPLAVVAQELRAQGDETASVLGMLTGETDRAVAVLGELSFKVSLAKLQVEMAVFFVGELATHEADPDSVAALAELTATLADSVEAAAASLDDLGWRLREIVSLVTRLTGSLQALDFLTINGRIEALRAGQDEAFDTLFEQIESQIATAGIEVGSLASATANKRLASTPPPSSLRGLLVRTVEDVGLVG